MGANYFRIDPRATLIREILHKLKAAIASISRIAIGFVPTHDVPPEDLLAELAEVLATDMLRSTGTSLYRPDTRSDYLQEDRYLYRTEYKLYST